MGDQVVDKPSQARINADKELTDLNEITVEGSNFASKEDLKTALNNQNIDCGEFNN